MSQAHQTNIVAWPSKFPCPLIAGTATEAYAGLKRTPMESGHTRQRRVHRMLPHLFNLSWIVKQATLYGEMVEWINDNGYYWFLIDLPSALAGAANKQTTQHTVRVVSDLSAELIQTQNQGYHWQLSLQVEWYPYNTIKNALNTRHIYMVDWVPTITHQIASPISNQIRP